MGIERVPRRIRQEKLSRAIKASNKVRKAQKKAEEEAERLRSAAKAVAAEAPDLTREQVVALTRMGLGGRAARSRVAQGLPPKIEDPVVIDRIMTIFEASRREAARAAEESVAARKAQGR